jgi:1-deoxy-D-xylulose-5-phosphate reductoisomerase
MAKKRIAIYGSTGSIGTQTLEVIAANPNLFCAEILTAHSNHKLLIAQAKIFKPSIVVIGNEAHYELVQTALEPLQIQVYCGQSALMQVAAMNNYDILLAAIVGYAGLESTLGAVEAGKTIALANKETLVVAGDIIMSAAAKSGAKILPVDSEHSAIFQCLVGESNNPIEKIILTASGGPFLGKKPNYLMNVRKDHALQHPNWVMGAKITIDSASLMNKGLEMIEAKWLFNLKNEQVEVIVHPQSIVHSLVQFTDGSLKAQMGLPDMKLPIQYALAFPNRIPNDFKRFNFGAYPTLSFEAPDLRTFRNLAIAQVAMKKAGNMPCIMNAANEVVVEAFLNNKIGFLEMSDIIEKSMDLIAFIEKPNLHQYIETDLQTRLLTQEFVNEFSFK